MPIRIIPYPLHPVPVHRFTTFSRLRILGLAKVPAEIQFISFLCGCCPLSPSINLASSPQRHCERPTSDIEHREAELDLDWHQDSPRLLWPLITSFRHALRPSCPLTTGTAWNRWHDCPPQPAKRRQPAWSPSIDLIHLTRQNHHNQLPCNCILVLVLPFGRLLTVIFLLPRSALSSKSLCNNLTSRRLFDLTFIPNVPGRYTRTDQDLDDRKPFIR